MAYYEGEVSGIGCNNGGYGMGSGWEGLIGLVLVAGLLGNGNFGGIFGNGRNGVGNELSGWQLGRLATTNDVASGFSTSEIMSDLNSIILGQATMQNFINQGFAGVNQTINSGFAGVDNAICTLGYQNQAGFNQIGNLIQSCCCDLKSINLENRYLNEKQTCDILAGQNAQTRAILDYLTSEKISALQAENSGLKAQISNDRQSAFIVDALSPKCPQPAYVVQPPQQVTFATNCCGGANVAGYGYNGCGCGASIQ